MKNIKTLQGWQNNGQNRNQNTKAIGRMLDWKILGGPHSMCCRQLLVMNNQPHLSEKGKEVRKPEFDWSLMHLAGRT